MLHRFDHVTIAVADLDAAVRSYQTLLGTAPCWRGEHPGLGTRAALFGLSNALIELVSPESDAPEAEGLRTLLETSGEGLIGFTLGTDDAAACTKQLRERGVRATPPEDGEARAGETLRRFRVVELSRTSTRKVSITVVERIDPIEHEVPTDPASLTALDHIVVRTADPEAALRLYRDGLGLRLALDRTFGTTRMLFFRIGKVTVEVVHDPSCGESDRLWGVAYRAIDLDGARERLVAGGFDVSDLREGRKAGTQVFTVRSGSASVPTLVLRDPARDAGE